MNRRPRLTLDRYDVLSIIFVIGMLLASLAYLIVNPWTVQGLIAALAAATSVAGSIAIGAAQR